MKFLITLVVVGLILYTFGPAIWSAVLYLVGILGKGTWEAVGVIVILAALVATFK